MRKALPPPSAASRKADSTTPTLPVRKQCVVAWAIVDDSEGSERKKLVTTVPLVSVIGYRDDFNWQQNDTHMNPNDVKAYVPAPAGTIRYEVQVEYIENVNDPKRPTTKMWVELGIQHPGDGTDEAYWMREAQETVAAYKRDLEEQDYGN